MYSPGVRVYVSEVKEVLAEHFTIAALSPRTGCPQQTDVKYKLLLMYKIPCVQLFAVLNDPSVPKSTSRLISSTV